MQRLACYFAPLHKMRAIRLYSTQLKEILFRFFDLRTVSVRCFPGIPCKNRSNRARQTHLSNKGTLWA